MTDATPVTAPDEQPARTEAERGHWTERIAALAADALEQAAADLAEAQARIAAALEVVDLGIPVSPSALRAALTGEPNHIITEQEKP